MKRTNRTTRTPARPASTPTTERALVNLKPDALTLWPGNSREHDPESLAELTASVRASGVLQPLLGRRADNGVEIVCGSRRLAASLAAGLDTVPVYVADMTDAQAAAAVLVENIDREDFSPLDAHAAVARAVAAYGSVNAAADAMAKSRGWTARVNSHSRLTGQWHAEARKRGLSLGFLYELARLPEPVQDQLMAERAVQLTADPGGNLRLLRSCAQAAMAAIPDTPWLRLDSDCEGCAMRSDTQPELFPDMARSAPQCLHPQCRESKRITWVASAQNRARKLSGDGRAVVATSDWRRTDDKTKKDAAHTIPVVIADGPDSGTIVWRKPDQTAPYGDATPRGPTPDARLAARHIRDVTEALDAGAIERALAGSGPEQLLSAALLFGVHGSHPEDPVDEFTAVDRWEQPALIRAVVADRIAAGVRERLKINRVSDCEAQYAWAKAVAEIFGIETKGAK